MLSPNLRKSCWGRREGNFSVEEEDWRQFSSSMLKTVWCTDLRASVRNPRSTLWANNNTHYTFRMMIVSLSC